ncbi:elongation factor G-binding protein [Lysinibacillus yapensis]|uniref:Elongation factor G-binding protein n=1 Tax=Ureibacillus yapensis TaxID=2304605 RepID=A0A396S5Y3_9BACL|nr:FusB/FusC family EF-G-binding protein [Lysinibacillus yapensis]RHW34974.1 elongation factor G-binding protein [Lysinibacillus yapensis]
MQFMTVEQYQLVKKQAKKILNTYTTTKDQKVIQAIQALVQEKIDEKLTFTEISQQLQLQPIFNIETKEQLHYFLNDIKPYVIPFQAPTANELKKLFPKEKKLKLPNLDSYDWKETSYLSWFDAGTNRKYIVYREEGTLKGVRGVFSHSEKVGICTVCNQHAKVGMLLVAKKGTDLGTYTKKGNYLCQDSKACNEALSDLSKFEDFVENLT